MFLHSVQNIYAYWQIYGGNFNKDSIRGKLMKKGELPENMPIKKFNEKGGENEEYKKFVEKFKPKKTTDDCYTPPEVYNVIADYVETEFNTRRADFVRPFYPGGDYEHFEYSPGQIVVDNPPFSILSKILEFYQARGIKYFLFSPHLTLFSNACRCGCAIVCNATIIYENGTMIKTSFVTNLNEENVIRTEPRLSDEIKTAQETVRGKRQKLPTYVYPDNVVTAALLGPCIARGLEVRIPKAEAYAFGNLDAMREARKKIFGSGYLVSDAYARRINDYKASKSIDKDTVFWQLSEREKELWKS